MLGRHFLIQLDPQAWFSWRYDVTVLPLKWLLDKLGVEPAKRLDTLLDQEIGAARSELYVGGGFDRPTVKMRCDLGLVCLRHARNLLGFQYTAYSTKRQLENGSTLPIK